MKGFRQKPRVLVVGGGTLAQALEKSFSLGGITTFRAGRNPGAWHLDLSRDPGCWNVPSQLDWVFVCAGMTSRAECEKQPHLSLARFLCAHQLIDFYKGQLQLRLEQDLKMTLQFLLFFKIIMSSLT